MSKIHKKLWYVMNADSLLAYMTYYEDNTAFLNRAYTGAQWARKNYDDYKDFENRADVGTIIDNVPIGGFIIKESVSRWSTSNKVIRILDPRGFIVEIPTANLISIIEDGKIIRGELQGLYIWGRDGSNHSLIRVGSKEYVEGITVTEFIKPKDLTVGDRVQILRYGDVQGKLAYFAGRVKITWQNEATDETVQDKWQWLFIEDIGGEYQVLFSAPPKVLSVVENKVTDFELKTRWMSDTPIRVKNRFKLGTKNSPRLGGHYGQSRMVEDTITPIEIEYK